jgi:ribulose-phosphate 3-epimerase
MIQIVPDILAQTESEFQEKLRKIESVEEFLPGWVHIDLMDNKFVQNFTIGWETIQKFPTKMKIEIHLMAPFPEDWIDDLAKLKVDRIIFPIEIGEGNQDRIDQIKNLGVQVGLALEPDTPVLALHPFISSLDTVLVMSVHSGFSGQKFIVQSIDKVKEIRSIYENITIGIDGGVNNRYVKPLEEAGANYLCINSYLMEGDINENLQKIKAAL